MTAHKHAKMIKAKADNMDLIVFIQHDQTEWEECVINKNCIPSFDPDFNYFLCLPQHKEACLHWLNGGDVLVKSTFVPSWEVVAHGQVWGDVIGWMREDAQYRIKPRTEKRWIIVDVKTNNTSFAYANKETALGDFKCAGSSSQIVEIEVEV